MLANKIGDRFPESEDLSGTVAALVHLQDLYELSADQVASGLLHSNIEHPVPMTRKMNNGRHTLGGAGPKIEFLKQSIFLPCCALHSNIPGCAHP